VLVAVAAIALSADVSVAKAAVPTGGNLPADQLIVWLSSEAMNGPVPSSTPAQAENARLRAGAIGADLHATSMLPLRAVVDPAGPLERGGTGGRPRCSWPGARRNGRRAYGHRMPQRRGDTAVRGHPGDCSFITG
jgi:hypothetical protein